MGVYWVCRRRKETLRYMWWMMPDSRGKAAIAPVRVMKSPKNGSKAPRNVLIVMYVPRVMRRTSIL
jgi:hypothetical protein